MQTGVAIVWTAVALASGSSRCRPPSASSQIFRTFFGLNARSVFHSGQRRPYRALLLYCSLLLCLVARSGRRRTTHDARLETRALVLYSPTVLRLRQASSRLSLRLTNHCLLQPALRSVPLIASRGCSVVQPVKLAVL